MGKRTRRNGKLLMALMLSGAMVLSYGSSAFADDVQTKSKTTTYRTVMEVEDFGPQIKKVIVDLGKTVNKNTVDTDTFKVLAVRIPNSENTPIIGDDGVGYRKVTKAYISDKDGNAAAKGNYAALELEIGPDISFGLPLNLDLNFIRNEWIECKYTITQQKDIKSGSTTVSGLVADVFDGGTRGLLDEFTALQGTYDNITMHYASYVPAKDGAKHPLIIWLHGMGEGGTDGLLGIAGNKGVNFASKEIQSYFNGAYVLGPQCPTFWMDGKTSNASGNAASKYKNVSAFADGTSNYEKALMALIKDYVAKNPDIDTNRIYIGGDSNGGYMTMLMARDYTGYFAAAFPTCEALKDTLITDSDIQKLKELPMWFVAAKTDTTVPVLDYTVPTYNRLMKAGAKNVHLSLFDNVIDTTGLYKKADGTPYEYNGHWSWIYVFNNKPAETINGKNVTIMEWLSEQSLNKEAAE
ncbi:prolyl oligopeptidase family serine peptidase [Clostridium sp. Marseille-P2415]|uniref:prolyl oligopeptidase family serine peptidase n=1 Tax=Clostridium sp. Marseille-P2415 TaxID=1805471 RepID=UPI0009883B07|nr:prolyl oligopeptidase family serine peptidase [Clostridium sp. Marseille-P2415]